MAKGFKQGGSGGANPLNFKVKAYLSETELKADTSKENTIGVITTTSISSWIFSSTEPSSKEVGMLWFSEGNSDVEFNALKKNAIQISPSSAKQYVNGKWEDVLCFTYVNNAWKAWISETYVYNAGDQCSDVTGGWTTVNGESETATLDSNKISFKVSSGSGRSACAYTNKKIDVSKYKTIVVSGNVTTLDESEEGKSLIFGLSDSNSSTDPSWSSSKTINSTGSFEQTLDISKANGQYYAAVYAHASNAEAHIYLLR